MTSEGFLNAFEHTAYYYSCVFLTQPAGMQSCENVVRGHEVCGAVGPTLFTGGRGFKTLHNASHLTQLLLAVSTDEASLPAPVRKECQISTMFNVS